MLPARRISRPRVTGAATGFEGCGAARAEDFLREAGCVLNAGLRVLGGFFDKCVAEK